jgi:hypothetical protein
MWKEMNNQQKVRQIALHCLNWLNLISIFGNCDVVTLEGMQYDSRLSLNPTASKQTALNSERGRFIAWLAGVFF